MQTGKLVGRDASVRKYDILTALAVSGLSGGKHSSVSMLRLISLITARYNWRADEVSIGQSDLAKLWSVDIRTVKREMKRLQELGVLTVKRAGARGRVSVYALNQDILDKITASAWECVGSDFEHRMSEQRDIAAKQAEMKVVQFPTSICSGLWGRAQSWLAKKDPARFNAWFRNLEFVSLSDDVISLRAQSEFQANYLRSRLTGEIAEALAVYQPVPPRIAIIV
ncbi:MAG: DnaA N-terminal domain-containing protein [Pseudomonadota bacterium]